MGRRHLVVGNWKMYKTALEAVEFIETLAPQLGKGQEAWLAVPFTAIAAAAEASKGTGVRVGAQNMNDASEGAFTGEIAAPMLKEAGARFVVLGHSERRHLFGEEDAFINRKVRRALKSNLTPILCIGETLEEREADQTHAVLERQLKEGLKGLRKLDQVIIAYEPVWAIGTGHSATPEMAQEAHRFIRSQFEGFEPTVLYGGSVKPINSGELIAQRDVDGFLVGGASLEPATFLEILTQVQA